MLIFFLIIISRYTLNKNLRVVVLNKVLRTIKCSWPKERLYFVVIRIYTRIPTANITAVISITLWLKQLIICQHAYSLDLWWILVIEKKKSNFKLPRKKWYVACIIQTIHFTIKYNSPRERLYSTVTTIYTYNNCEYIYSYCYYITI